MFTKFSIANPEAENPTTPKRNNSQRSLYDKDRFKPDTLSREENIRLLAVHPKSALLNLKVVYPGSEVYRNQATMYGSIGAVLKESVKSRSVWASDDTLMSLINPFETPRKDFERNLEKDKLEINLHKEALDLNYGTFTHKALLPKKGYGETYNLHGKNWYRETLIYGSIDPQDIDHFIVESEWLSPEVFESLKLFNVPIYQLVRTQHNVFEAGAVLYMPPSNSIAP